MMLTKQTTAILLLTCPDQAGLVARISHFIFEHGGNILDLDEHVDTEEKLFSIRIAWDMENFSIPASQLQRVFAPMAKEFDARWDIKFPQFRQQVAVFVSKYDHCLLDLLWRHKMGEFAVDIACVVSNHPDLEPLAQQYGVPFHLFPITKATKKEQEAKELELLTNYHIDTIVLARYMQILSANFVQHYPNNIINIHHSFLPAFVGSNPYQRAFDRGVKIVGASSHYVTEDLDEGPIIDQGVIHISHKNTVKDLVRKGRDLERTVLAHALQLHFEYRLLVQGRKTIVFE